jgi:triosephosphate isomerase
MTKMKVMIFVNFKDCKQGVGEEAVNLAKICADVEKETSINIIPIVQVTDVSQIAGLGVEVWSQATVIPGATGVLLNHSDYKLDIEIIGEEIKRIKDPELRIMVCAESIEEGKEITKFGPDFIAYEPPELIGGNVSVSSARPEIISEFVREIKEVSIIVGAGIHNQLDVQKAMELGAKGILVSHAVVESDAPKSVLLNLAKGF